MRVAYNNENKTWPGFVVEEGRMLKWPPVSAKTGHSLISRDWEVLDSFFRLSAISGTLQNSLKRAFSSLKALLAGSHLRIIRHYAKMAFRHRHRVGTFVRKELTGPFKDLC